MGSLVPMWSRDVSPNIAQHQAMPRTRDGLVIEAWAQGYLVGSLIIMAFITIANMRRGVLLHKMILLELLLGIWQGFWLFPGGDASSWWLSAAAIPLNTSWFLHNIISWLKIKPFLSRSWSLVFLYTVVLSSGYWILEIYANFSYFNGHSPLFKRTRPFELLFRDPWWIITTIYLFYIISTHYALSIRSIIRISPRFGVMLAAMLLSIAFVICDVCAVTGALRLATAGTDTGINPWWKFAFVFKCLTDCVVLDDFKVALDRLRAFKISRLGSFEGGDLELGMEGSGSAAEELRRPPLRSPRTGDMRVHESPSEKNELPPSSSSRKHDLNLTLNLHNFSSDMASTSSSSKGKTADPTLDIPLSPTSNHAHGANANGFSSSTSTPTPPASSSPPTAKTGSFTLGEPEPARSRSDDSSCTDTDQDVTALYALATRDVEGQPPPAAHRPGSMRDSMRSSNRHSTTTTRGRLSLVG